MEKPTKVRLKSYLATLVVVTLYLQSAFVSAPAGIAQDLTTTSDSNQITLAYPFKLGVNQTAYLLPADLVFRFVNVTEDSRCPSDVQCIWAGQVSILIEYSRASTGQSLGNFTLTLMGSSSTEISTTIEGYLVKLARVDPYPVSTEQIQPSNYVATLIVLKADIGTPDSFVASGPVVLDGTSGERLENLQVGMQVTLSMALHNSFDDDRQFIAIMEARSLDDRGITRFLAMSNGTVSGKGWIDASLSWMPEQAGEYQLRTFVIDSLVEPRVLTPVMTAEIMVHENTKGESIVTLREGQREGPLLVQKIYADRVEGLNFLEYPVAMDSGLPITLRIGEKASNGCTIVLTLTKIQGDSATFLKTVDENRPCPICWYQLGLMTSLR